MANNLIDWALKQALAAVQKLVLLVLANRADGKTHECFPSLTTIARETGLARSTVTQALGRLESLGLIRRQRKPYQSTLYVLLMEGRSGDGLVLNTDQTATRHRVGRDTAQSRSGHGPAVVRHAARNPQLNPNGTQREPRGKTAP